MTNSATTRTHCFRGHELTAENLFSNGRSCRLCAKFRYQAKADENRAKASARYRANPEPVRARNRRYRSENRASINATRRDVVYGLKAGEYDAILAAQRGVCGLCGQPFAGTGLQKTAAVVDHCHTTGKVRGIIHSGCNVGLGMFGDSPAALAAAIEYLERHDQRRSATALHN